MAAQIAEGWNWLILIVIIIIGILVANWLMETFEAKQLRAG